MWQGKEMIAQKKPRRVRLGRARLGKNRLRILCLFYRETSSHAFFTVGPSAIYCKAPINASFHLRQLGSTPHKNSKKLLELILKETSPLNDDDNF